jgi:hypothetical protein
MPTPRRERRIGALSDATPYAIGDSWIDPLAERLLSGWQSMHGRFELAR